MKVHVKKDGSFAFYFDADEKQLGVDILESFNPTHRDAERAIQQSISLIKTYSEPLPDNVVPIR